MDNLKKDLDKLKLKFSLKKATPPQKPTVTTDPQPLQPVKQKGKPEKPEKPPEDLEDDNEEDVEEEE